MVFLTAACRHHQTISGTLRTKGDLTTNTESRALGRGVGGPGAQRKQTHHHTSRYVKIGSLLFINVVVIFVACSCKISVCCIIRLGPLRRAMSKPSGITIHCKKPPSRPLYHHFRPFLLQIDLGRVRVLSAVATQGYNYNLWTTQYQMNYSMDGMVWKQYTEKGTIKVGWNSIYCWVTGCQKQQQTHPI